MADSIPLPSSLTEEAVALWVECAAVPDMHETTTPAMQRRYLARAILALVEAKVREAVMEAIAYVRFDSESVAKAQTKLGAYYLRDAIVARILGKEASRG